MGKSSINGSFSMAMLNNHRVCLLYSMISSQWIFPEHAVVLLRFRQEPFSFSCLVRSSKIGQWRYCGRNLTFPFEKGNYRQLLTDSWHLARCPATCTHNVTHNQLLHTMHVICKVSFANFRNHDWIHQSLPLTSHFKSFQPSPTIWGSDSDCDPAMSEKPLQWDRG